MAAKKAAAQENQDHLHLMAKHSLNALVPKKHRQAVDDLLLQANAKGVSPDKVAKALMALILGGFTFEAFQNAITILFGA